MKLIVLCFEILDLQKMQTINTKHKIDELGIKDLNINYEQLRKANNEVDMRKAYKTYLLWNTSLANLSFEIFKAVLKMTQTIIGFLA